MASLLGHAERTAPAQVRRVIWSLDAIDDLIGIRAYIAQFNAFAAQRLSQRLESAALGLERSSERGRVVAHDVRQLAVVRPYLIRYRVEDDVVVILRIRHSRRQD